MIIDFHTHTFPDTIAAAAIDKLQAASHTRPFADGTVAGLGRSMAAAGIDASVVLPVATSARQVPHINDSAIRLNHQARETGIYSFGGMHPDFEEADRELERLAAAGIRGVKLHPPYQGVDFDDPRYLRILKKAAEMGLAVLIHAGKDVGLPGAEQATPDKIRRAMDAVPEGTLILAHMGGWRCWEQAARLLPGTGAYIDTSFALGNMTPTGDGFYKTPDELAMLTPDQAVDLIRLFGADHVLFGTDCPWSDQAAYLRQFQALPLTDREKTAILGGNAARLLGM
ncbi:MAG: amidohydrolase family protein [Clostridia bacterium]|nr:amidohydrolase family protein [Clostridia bacterium]